MAMPCTCTLWLCIASVHCGHVLHLCIAFMHCTCASWPCVAAMHCSYASWLCLASWSHCICALQLHVVATRCMCTSWPHVASAHHGCASQPCPDTIDPNWEQTGQHTGWFQGSLKITTVNKTGVKVFGKRPGPGRLPSSSCALTRGWA